MEWNSDQNYTKLLGVVWCRLWWGSKGMVGSRGGGQGVVVSRGAWVKG